MKPEDRFDMSQSSGEAIKEFVNIPGHGFASFDPNTMVINGHNEPDGLRASAPVELPKRFWKTKQPHIRTCSEPVEGNAGCPKWPGCKIGQKYPYVGPGPVIMRDRGIGPPTMAMCYDFFETTRGGRSTSQNHYGLDGFKLDTSRTTIEMLGRTNALQSGRLSEESSRQAVVGSKPSVSEHEVHGLLPPWWPMMKKKGLPLPASSELYPELADEEPIESPRAAYRGVRKRAAKH